MSLPSWECGLKYSDVGWVVYYAAVTPFVGVWIEILCVFCASWAVVVTPFVGVWIEIAY